MTEEQGMEFSIVRGGALYRREQSLGLVGPENLGVHKRAIIFATITWLPLAILSIIQGAAVGASYHDAFLPDFAAHARFLVAGSLLIIAEAVAQRRMQCVADKIASRSRETAIDSRHARQMPKRSSGSSRRRIRCQTSTRRS